jgi:hypothetical protein
MLTGQLVKIILSVQDNFCRTFATVRRTFGMTALSDNHLIETDLLKTGFLFEFSSFPCTFGSMFGTSINDSAIHKEREVRPLSRNPNFQSTIAVYIF